MEPVFYTIDNFIHNLSQIKYINIKCMPHQMIHIDEKPYEVYRYSLRIYYNYTLNEDEYIQHTFLDNEDNEMSTLINFLSCLSAFKGYDRNYIYQYLQDIKNLN